MSSIYLDKILRTTTDSGQFWRFEVDSISYYPIPRIQEDIALKLYGFKDVSRPHLAPRELYDEFREKMEKNILISPAKPLNHQKAEGEFLLMPEEKTMRGVLGIRKLITENQHMCMSIISPNAFFPNYHQVCTTQIPSGIQSISLYTKDADGSDWSIHCK